MECFTKFDSVFERHFHGGLAEFANGNTDTFTGVSADIQNDLIASIDSAVQEEIDNDVKSYTFLSIQIDEATDVSTKAQLSTILRLDKEGTIAGRFFKFTDASADRSASSMADSVKNILCKYGDSLKKKLIMQTYDGAADVSGQIAGVKALVRQEYKLLFVRNIHLPSFSIVLHTN